MKRLISLLRKIKATESDGWGYAKENTCCPGDNWADGYNQAVKDVIKLIKAKFLT